MHLFWAMALKDLFFFSSLFSTHLPRKKKKIYLMAQKRGQEEEGGSGVVVKVVFKGFFWWLPRREGRKKSTISQISVLEGKKVEIFFSGQEGNMGVRGPLIIKLFPRPFSHLFLRIKKNSFQWIRTFRDALFTVDGWYSLSTSGSPLRGGQRGRRREREREILQGHPLTRAKSICDRAEAKIASLFSRRANRENGQGVPAILILVVFFLNLLEKKKMTSRRVKKALLQMKQHPVQ